MSLGKILDDIEGGIKDVSLIDKDISTENIDNTILKTEDNSIENETNVDAINIEKISTEELNNINNTFNLITLKSNIDKLTHLDRNTALEVFTMLPNVNEVDKSKLTSVPSIINKEIIYRVFNTNVDHKVSIDIIEKISDIKQTISKKIPVIDELVNFFETFNNEFNKKTAKFEKTNPVVMEYTKNINNKVASVNLFTDSFNDIIKINDCCVLYEKYANKLTSLFADIYHCETLGLLDKQAVYISDLNKLSLLDFKEISEKCIGSLGRIKTSLEQYLGNLSAIDSSKVIINNSTITILNGTNDIVDKLETITVLHSIVSVKNNCFDAALELIDFID